MDIVGTGFGRTGTLSTKLALERLGFGPCHHMFEAIQHPRQFRTLAAYVSGETVDWREFFAGYRSQVDYPGAVIWRELLDAFPDAKVIHTVRNADRWYDSTASTIYRARTCVAPWVRRLVPFIDRSFEVNEAMIWDGLFEGRFDDRRRAIEIFEQRTADVIATVPQSRLLIFRVEQGWEPLCSFLGVPIPDEPFPHANESRRMRLQFGLVRFATYGAPWIGAAVLAARISPGLLTRAVETSHHSSRLMGPPHRARR